jgi:hypothetical protein
MKNYEVMRNTLYSKLTWEFLNKIYTIEYFKFFLFGFTVTPIFVNSINLISKNSCIEGSKEVSNFCSIINGMALPFSWKVMWIGSIFYLFSYVIYLLFCPYFVKKYKNIENYIYKNLPNRSIIHEWADFVANNRVNLIRDEQFFEKLKGSLFNSKISASISPIKFIKCQPTYSFIGERNSGFFVGQTGNFIIYGVSDERVVLIRYDDYIFSKENNINEDYKEIVFSLFDLSEKIRRKCKIFCYSMVFVSGLCFLIVLIQNIMKTIFYIVNCG